MTVESKYYSKPWLNYYPEDVPATVEIPEKSIPQLFDEATEKYASRTAIIFYGKKFSYRDLREKVDRFACALQELGVAKGDRVALYLLNSPQFIIAYFGALKAGAILTTVSPVYTSVELQYQLKNSKAQHIICQDVLYENFNKTGVKMKNVIITGINEYLPLLKRLAGKSVMRKAYYDLKARVPQDSAETNICWFKELIDKFPPTPREISLDPIADLACLSYTGGTTAHPKGVMLTHYNIIACKTQVNSFWSIFEEGKEVIIAFLPFYHIYGQVVIMFNGICTGSTLVLFTTPDVDDILYSMEKNRATSFYGVPSLYEHLKDYNKTARVNWKRLKMVVCGGDTLNDTLVDEWEERTGRTIIQGYGMTETSAVSNVNPFNRPSKGSLGVPIPNMNAAVIDPDTNRFKDVNNTGELILNGPNIMQGYWENEQETGNTLIEIDGKVWLKTGDLVKMDEEGYFYFYDRIKDLIKFKGYSVFAREIEDALYQHSQVKAVGVVGVPDDRVGQYIKANIVLYPEARGKVSEEDLINYCRERLAHYKVPRVVELRGELPKTDVGKVSRRELREEAEGV